MEEFQAKPDTHDAGAPLPDRPDDPSLPGYLLLIDEPEKHDTPNGCTSGAASFV